MVKEYTPEYAAKLEARRIAKQPDEAELLAMAEEARRNGWQTEGFSREGIGYMYKGNTYPHKDVIRRAGGKWCSYMSAWIAPKLIDGLKDVQISEIHAEDVCTEYGHINPEKIWDLMENA